MCYYYIWNFVWLKLFSSFFLSHWFETYSDIATAWVATRYSNSFSPSIQLWFLLFSKKSVKILKIYQNIKIARFKLKKLGEINYILWIMLVNPITRKSYFCLNVIIRLIDFNKFNYFTNAAWLSIRSYIDIFG